jgi:hypothetical protein
VSSPYIQNNPPILASSQEQLAIKGLKEGWSFMSWVLIALVDIDERPDAGVEQAFI